MEPITNSVCNFAGASQLASPGSFPELVDAGHPRRQQVEAFIAQRFLEVHNARITAFMPQLLALHDDDDRVLAAVGLRAADGEPLFLEHYLELPVEQAIRRCTGAGGSRDDIVEIGNLASRSRRASRQLFTLLARHLDAQRYRWAVFTGCSSLQHMFDRLGIETVTLGRALQARLPRDQQTWGSYYEDAPRVVAGRIACGLEVFERLEVLA